MAGLGRVERLNVPLCLACRLGVAETGSADDLLAVKGFRIAADKTIITKSLLPFAQRANIATGFIVLKYRCSSTVFGTERSFRAALLGAPKHVRIIEVKES